MQEGTGTVVLAHWVECQNQPRPKASTVGTALQGLTEMSDLGRHPGSLPQARAFLC